MSPYKPGMSPDSDDDYDFDVLTKPKTKPKIAVPKMYSVLFVNDDYTPMEFVVLVLNVYLNINLEDAARIMLKVHNEGIAKVGRFTLDVCETKVVQIMDRARKDEHPLVVQAVEAD